MATIMPAASPTGDASTRTDQITEILRFSWNLKEPPVVQGTLFAMHMEPKKPPFAEGILLGIGRLLGSMSRALPPLPDWGCVSWRPVLPRGTRSRFLFESGVWKNVEGQFLSQEVPAEIIPCAEMHMLCYCPFDSKENLSITTGNIPYVFQGA